MKLALAMIVRGTAEEAEYIDRCLSYIAKYVDGIFITITNKKGETPPEDIKEVCKRWNAEVSYFEWINDFSAARNFNFSQVPKEFTHILWLDADDAVRGAEKLKEIIKKHEDVDCFSMYYMYAFDEWKNPIVVHLKTQVVKNNGCITWSGKLHEDFKENRQVNRFLIKGIERIHLSDDKRFEDAKVRNLEIAEGELAESPSDPRSYWNVANSLKALGKYEESIDVFRRFLDLSNSEEEKYIAYLRMAESKWALDKKSEAIDFARYAVGLRPEYPDAYHLLGSLYFNSKQYTRARDMYLIGLLKKPPYHSIIVYNPRDYDYVPLSNLAKTYFQLGLPQLALPALKGCLKIYPNDKRLKGLVKMIEEKAKEADKVVKIAGSLSKIEKKEELKKKLDEIPIELQSHPAICAIRNNVFIKEKSSGKDLVFFCGYTAEEWNPEIAKEKGIGGSEEAVIHLAELLAQKGWNVTVYNRCGHQGKKYGNVMYLPFWAWNHRDKQDVVIVWRVPRYVEYGINADKIFLDMHDVVSDGEFTQERLNKITKVFVKSKFHRSLFPSVPDDKIAVIPNGIESEKFKENKERDRFFCINTSSPDRSLNTLLELIPRVREKVKEAKFAWAYGWNVFDAIRLDEPQAMKWKDKILEKIKNTEGFIDLGRLNHDEIRELYLTANIFAYPTEFAEIDCISLSKAMASGAIPVTSDFSSLGEKAGHGGVFVHSKKTKDTWNKPYQIDFGMQDESMKQQWVDAVVNLLLHPPSEEERNTMRKWSQEEYSWIKVADLWEEEMGKSGQNKI